ncbi:MAG: ISL3 family transposase [Chloroflexi bacterium]|nr:MAG: ISL3 family transposase [Chloroflexota bacterium]
MTTSLCFPLIPPDLAIVETKIHETELLIFVQSTRASAPCPTCGARSSRHHSSYLRRIQDSPIALFTVWLHLKVRRFRCDNQHCPQKTFAEQQLELVGRRRRRTQRLLMSLTHIALALAGAAGARLADKLAMTVSASTLLRLLHHLEVPPVVTPRIIGIDEWAFRKGEHYGTLIIDQERRKPIALLPERDGERVKQWLEKQPSIEMVTRDRAGEFREAITQALPDAIPIADRWHLFKNLREALERHISRRYQLVRQLITHAVSADHGEHEAAPIGGKARRYAGGPAQAALHAARTETRATLFAAVKERHQQGGYTGEIAKELNLSRKTVSRWVHCESLPPDARGRFKRKGLIDDYIPYLQQRIEAGCTNQSQLWREIAGQGFTGNRSLVAKWVRQHYATQDQPTAHLSRKPTKVKVPGAKELAWLLFRHHDELAEEEKQLVDVILQDAKLAEFRQRAHEFLQIVRNGLSEQWVSWLENSCESAVKELSNFALGLRKDASAIREAIQQSWSNGATEGHVNRLKYLKRQMYGRASFDLLRIRVLLVD